MKSILLAVLLACSPAYAFTTEPGQKLPPHITYYIPDAGLEASFLSGFKQWNDATDNYFDLQKTDDASTAVITVESVDSLPSDYVGMTYATGISASIQILQPPPVNDLYSLDRVVLHEIGHALGLGHSQDTSAVMYFSPIANELSIDDVAGARCIYKSSTPADLSLSITMTGRGRNRKFACNYPANWSFGDGLTYNMQFASVVHHFTARGWYRVSATYLGATQTLNIRIR